MVRLGRERILMGSEPKSGKTTAIAWIIKMQPRSKFVVLEYDDGFTKVANEHGIAYRKLVMPQVQSNGALTDLALPSDQVVLFPVPSEWMDFYNQVATIDKWCQTGKLGPNDWVIVEAIDICYDEIIGEYAEATAEHVVSKAENKGKTAKGLAGSSWNAFISKRKSDAPILEGSDYNAIYTELRKTLNYLAFQMPCHLIMTCGMEAVTKGMYENKDETNFYSSMGMTSKFQGYKKVPRIVDTLIQFTRSMSGFKYQVHGDRGQTRIGNTIAPQQDHFNTAEHNFFVDFLVQGGFQGQGSLPTNGAVAPVPVLTPPSLVAPR